MKLAELEVRLREISHGDQAIALIRSFVDNLNKKERIQVFNAQGALVRSPISFAGALASGAISEGEDPFVLLQGDIVRTDAVYHQGERLIGRLHVVATASCDLIEGRQKFATLLPISVIRIENAGAKQLLGELLSFKSTRRMYLPPLSDDPAEVGCAIEMSQLASCEMKDLLLARRIASMSLIGWRILGSYLRGYFTRAGEGEVRMRTTLQGP